MKKFPFELFFVGELMSAILALKDFHQFGDIVGVFLFLQIPILSIVGVIWLDRRTRDNK